MRMRRRTWKAEPLGCGTHALSQSLSASLRENRPGEGAPGDPRTQLTRLYTPNHLKSSLVFMSKVKSRYCKGKNPTN